MKKEINIEEHLKAIAGYINLIAKTTLEMEKEGGFVKESPREWVKKVFIRTGEASDWSSGKLDTTVDVIIKRFEEMKEEEQ